MLHPLERAGRPRAERPKGGRSTLIQTTSWGVDASVESAGTYLVVCATPAFGSARERQLLESARSRVSLLVDGRIAAGGAR